MSERLRCPGCERVLHLPRELTDPWVSCPRCLAHLRNPQGGQQAETPRAEGGRSASCPGCGKAVEPRWLFCPFCDERLLEGLPVPGAGPDQDVRRDNLGTRVFLILLAVLGGIGIFVTLMSSLSALSENEPAPLFITLAVLFVLAVASTLIVLVRGKERSSLPTPARIVVGTFTLAGALTAGSCLLAAAAFIFLLVVCAFA